MNRKILVICALGYATSTMMKKNIEALIEENDFENWSVEAVGLQDSKNHVKDADVIVTSVGLDQKDYNIPVINGIPLISGINKKATLESITNSIREIEL